MQGRTRYISIQLGIGGFQAIPADKVERTGYGDCKALSNYLEALLNYAGIASNQVLVRAGRDVMDVMDDFPSNQFNHVFVAVPLPGDTVLLECTSQIVPPDYIGTFTDDRNVLWTEKGASRIVRMPTYGPNENMKVRNGFALVDENGNADILLKNDLSGLFFDEVLAYKSLSQDQVERLNNHKFGYKDFTIKSFDYEIPDADEPQMNLFFQINARNLGQVVSGKLYIPVDVLASVEENIFVDPFNKIADVRRAFSTDDKVEVRIPDKFRMDNLPEEQEIVTSYGEMRFSFSKMDENTVRIHRQVVFYKGQYKDEEFSAFYAYLKKVRLAGQSKLAFQSKT